MCIFYRPKECHYLKRTKIEVKLIFFLFITFYWAGFYSCPEGKGTRGLQGPIQRCPTSPTETGRVGEQCPNNRLWKSELKNNMKIQ